MSPTVVFDGAVLTAAVTGVGRGLLDTLRAYAELGDQRCVLLLAAGVQPPAGSLPDRVELRPGPVGPITRQLALPRLLRQLGATVYHSPVAAIPWRAPCPTVATVHDLPWLAPEPLHEPGCRLRHRLAVRRALRHASVVVVPSQATADDLDRWASGKARVIVVPHGVAPPQQPAADRDLRGPFLILGDDRPRKNLARIREAHRRARNTCPDLPDLQCIGPGAGYVDEQTKYQLLRRARAVLQFSLFEGFGLPVLEAMQHGVPVLCSDRGSLPEVAGNAALIADPTNPDAMAAAMIRIHTDLDLRQRLCQLGRRRAANLTPTQAATRWLEIHADLSNRGSAIATDPRPLQP